MARGSGRGRVQSYRGRQRSRGGARGRGKPSSYQRNGFKSSRVQDTEDLDEAAVSNSTESSSDVGDAADQPNSASEDEVIIPRQSYTALLQVLKAKKTVDEPARKKQKIATGMSNPSQLQSIDQTSQRADHDNEQDDGVADAQTAEEVEDEGLETFSNAEDADSEDEDIVLHDPFEQHYAKMEEKALQESIAAQKDKTVEKSLLSGQIRKQKTTYDQPRQPVPISGAKINQRLKRRLQGPGSQIMGSWSAEQRDLSGEIFSYLDVQYANRTFRDAQALRDTICLHALNHVFKTRDRVLKNNAKLSQQDSDDTLDLRDQGFTRPKVLFIVPTKQACVRFVDSIIKLSEPDQQENKSRFLETFSQEDDDALENKPEDFQELFGGNHEEDFRVGLKFTRKTIKYFSGFYNSDIIFGSALGLMRTITTGGGGKDKKKEHDADFLSSVEIVVVDHGAAIQMQNFQHLEYVLSQLNHLPKDSHGCDFARVRNWYLNGDAKYLRQTVLFTSHHTPELNSLFSAHTNNIAGLVKYTPIHAGAMLSLPQTLSAYTIPQTFLRFDSSSPQLDADSRFKFFTTTVLPSLLRHASSSSSASSSSKGTLLFVPGYFDFIRLRNHFSSAAETVSLSFGSISEYTSVRDTARARSHFMNGRHTVLLYSERAHHHFRYRLRGVRRVLFYGVPENPTFWAEIVGCLGLNAEALDEMNGTGAGGTKGGKKSVVRALFSKWDVLKLERIVGTERVGNLVNEKGGDTFEFV